MGWLKENGADINAKNDKGETPMYFAARFCQVDSMKWLKESGADVNTKSDSGETPLQAAQIRQNEMSERAAEWLKANGAE